MTKLTWLVPVILAAFILTGCHSHGHLLRGLMANAPTPRTAYFAKCDPTFTQQLPNAGPAMEDWRLQVNAASPSINFEIQYAGDNCALGTGISQDYILFAPDPSFSVCAAGSYICSVRILNEPGSGINPPPGPSEQTVKSVGVFTTPNFWNLSSAWQGVFLRREIGWFLGLAKHNSYNCQPYEGKSFSGVMGRKPPDSSAPCETTVPITDAIGVSCGSYRFDCPSQSIGGGLPFFPALGAAVSTVKGLAGAAGDFLGITQSQSVSDVDRDGVEDSEDNCPTTSNVLQEDLDIDGQGDACDSDIDSDGYSNAAENHVGTLPSGACGVAGMPADLVSGGVPSSTDRVNVLDLASFLAPRRLNTSPGDSGYNVRWDIVPGSGTFAKVINVSDLASLLALAPPLYDGERVFNNPNSCLQQRLAQVQDVVKAVDLYRNPANAEAAGFQQFIVEQPGRGTWLANLERLETPAASRLEPTGLVYDVVGNTSILAGVFYVQPIWQGVETPSDLFAGNGDAWSYHSGFCISPDYIPREGLTEEQCGNLNGQYWPVMGWDLFLWLKKNPSGDFAEENPAIH